MALTEAQQKRRVERITSTRAPAIVGCDSSKSLHGAAREILGIDDVVVTTGPMERGTFMEEGIARWFTHRTGTKLRKAVFRVHPTVPYFGDSADYLAIEHDKPVGVVECKNYLSGKRWEYGEPGTDEVDQRTYIQSVWHMAHHDLPRCWVPLASYDLDIYVVQRDREIEEAVLLKCRMFWEQWIEPNLKRLAAGTSALELELPPVDGKEATSEWIKKRLTQKKGDLIPGDDVAFRMTSEYRRLSDEIKKLEEQKEEAANGLRLRIGENLGLDFGDNGRVTWGHVKGRSITDYKSIVAEARIPDEVIQRHTRVGEGHRALRCNLKEGK